jgi:N4-gp56 family major capsid protein
MKQLLSRVFWMLLLLPLTVFAAEFDPQGGTVTTQGYDAAGFVSIPEAVRAVYSQEVLFEAQPRLKFLQFAKVKTDLQAQRGKSISFTKYSNLAGGGTINEQDVLAATGLSTSEVTITVHEQGNAVTVSELALRTSLLDVLGDASKLLAVNMATVLDTQFRDAVLATTNVVYGAGNTTLAGISDGDGLTTQTVKDVVEVLATNNAPKIMGEFYVCIAHPHQLRQLRDDNAWINAQAYRGTGRQLYLGEVGMYEGVVFIESTQMPALNTAQVVAKYGAGYTATNGWEAVFFGENAYAWAIALPVELRDDGVTNLGRFHTLGWYGIWGTGIIEENSIVKVLSA